MTTVTSTPSSRTTRPPAPWQLLAPLQDLATADLVASVHLGTRSDVRHGADRVLSIRQAVRDRLRDEGAPAAPPVEPPPRVAADTSGGSDG